MHKLAVLAFVSLDGVMQAPGSPEEDKSAGFDKGGWAAPYWDDVMPDVMSTAMAEPFEMVLGRKTYDLFAGYWPTAPQSDTTDKINTARKHVVTSSGDPLAWNNSVAVSGDVAGKIAALKAADGPLLQVHGSSQLIRLLQDENLIDTYRIWTFPVVLGAGKRLFGPGTSVSELRLLEAASTAKGVVRQFYTTT